MGPVTITKRQKQVLDFIASQEEKNGYAPSLDEIATKFKLASVSTAHFHVKKLQEAGYLDRVNNKSRAMSVYKGEIPEPIGKSKTKTKGLGLEEARNKIILGDAIEELKKLPSESCDVIIIDPPYNIGKDFGNNIDKRDLVDYVVWSKEWIDESIRLLKPNGTLFIYGFSEILAHLSVEIPIKKRWLIWHYTNKNVASLNFWQRSHEAIICAWKDTPIFHRDDIREPYTEGFLKGAAGKQRKGTIGRFSSGGKVTTYNAHERGALPRDVIKIPALAGGAGMVERWFLCKTCDDVFAPRELIKHEGHELIKHPTQKPLDLSRKLVLSAAPKSKGLVLVPFVGTGSECVAAKQYGHDYIGFELNPDYIKIAEKYISSIQNKQQTLI